MTTEKKKVARNKGPSRRKSTRAGQSETIDFHYLKGPDFRSVHIDGAIGGLTTRGFLHIALFAERAVIPQKLSYNISPDGTLGDELLDKRESKEGIVRQMEIDIIVNEDTAKDLRNWLDQKLEEFEDRRKKLQELSKRVD